MSSHQRRTKRAYFLWLLANGVVLVIVVAWILKPNASGDDANASAATQFTITNAVPGVANGGLGVAPPVTTVTKAQVMAVKGIRFGLSAPQVPYSASEIATIAKGAGATPTMLQFFVKWTEDFPPNAIAASYRQGALPVLSWEPWAGVTKGLSQPAYALSKIYGGDFDAYITKFATAVRDSGVPLAIRFAHEMNGVWYPWSESMSGNHKGDYVKAWRHVHDIFTKVGATNVIWIWSPNILRPVPHTSLKDLYPGDAYVDWVGIVGYDVPERTAAPVFMPTIRAIEKFTAKPFVITETGSQPSSFKAAWIASFFKWLPTQPKVIGFIWFEYSKPAGGTADWRFMANTATRTAFHKGMSTLHLAPPPPPGSGQ